MHHDLKSWRKVGETLGLPARTVWRYAMTDYEPKRLDIRKILGLEQGYEITYVRQVRGPNGTFSDADKIESTI